MSGAVKFVSGNAGNRDRATVAAVFGLLVGAQPLVAQRPPARCYHRRALTSPRHCADSLGSPSSLAARQTLTGRKRA